MTKIQITVDTFGEDQEAAFALAYKNKEKVNIEIGAFKYSMDVTGCRHKDKGKSVVKLCGERVPIGPGAVEMEMFKEEAKALAEFVRAKAEYGEDYIAVWTFGDGSTFNVKVR